MAWPDSDFPGGIDAVTDPDATLDGTPLHSELHEFVADAINKIETELGTSPSGTESTVADRFDAIPNGTLIRSRRHRNGTALAGTATTAMFGSSTTGTSQESVGGITFTTDPSNGYFTIPASGTYAITVVVDPAASIGTSSTINFITSSSTHLVPVAGGSSRSVATLVRYLSLGATLAVSFTNGAAATTADMWEIEITRIA